MEAIVTNISNLSVGLACFIILAYLYREQIHANNKLSSIIGELKSILEDVIKLLGFILQEMSETNPKAQTKFDEFLSKIRNNGNGKGGCW